MGRCEAQIEILLQSKNSPPIFSLNKIINYQIDDTHSVLLERVCFIKMRSIVVDFLPVQNFLKREVIQQRAWYQFTGNKVGFSQDKIWSLSDANPYSVPVRNPTYMFLLPQAQSYNFLHVLKKGSSKIWAFKKRIRVCFSPKKLKFSLY